MGRAVGLAIVCYLASCTPIRPLDPIGGDAGRDAGVIERDAAIDASVIDAGSDAGCDPAAPDVCNGIDDDCDPATEDGSGDTRAGMPCDGADTDLCTEGTYGACAGGALACSDATDDTVERCDFLGADEDCDGMVDEAGALGAIIDFVDADRDGYGDDSMPMSSCMLSPGFATRGGDCDDTDPNIRPGRAEDCNAADDDCDGMIDDGNPCTDGCTTGSYGGHTYQFCENNRGWDGAQGRCAAFGYHLVTIETAEENDWLIMESLARGIGVAISNGAWIGLRYQGAAFVWTDGSTPTFTDWGSTEPNQMACGRLRPGTADWGDLDCTQNLDWICEAP